MEINLSYEKMNNECSMLIGVLGVSVSKHLLDGHFTCVWANDYYYEMIGYKSSEFGCLFQNRLDEYFHNNQDNWILLKKSTMNALANGEQGNTAYLQLLRPDGRSFWVKFQSAFTNEYINDYQVAYTIMTDVTEIMEAREKQEQTQQVYEKMSHEQEMLMDALNVSVSKHLIDEHFTCVKANKHYYRLIGYEKEKYEALFHNHADEFYRNNPEGWKLLSQKVTEVLARGGDQYEILIPMKYEDGSSYWVNLYSYFTDEYINGCRTSYTVMTDVTELVQMRNEQEMLIRAMNVSVSRYLVDEHFTMVWANDAYYEMIGYTREKYEASFHNHCDAYFADNRSGYQKIREKISEMNVRGEKTYELFLPLRIPDGSTRWVKMVGFFTDEYQDGKQIAYTTMVNVTDLMLTRQEKSIAYDNIPGFIVKHRILPDTIRIMDASERITEVFDVDLDHIDSFDMYAALQPESRAMIEVNHPQFLKGEPFEGTIHVKDRFHKDRWFRIHSTCMDLIADVPIYLTVFIDVTDVTELRELQAKLEERTRLLNTALEAAKRANEAKSDFLSSMSHDIRTPMNAIVGMTKLAGDHLNEPERMMDCLQKIKFSSHHLLGLINDVLDMSKIENGNFPINMTLVSLPEVLQEVIMIMLSDTRSRNQIFETHLIGLNQEEFTCDELRLRQILLNLLSNASKFTPEGGRIVFDVEQLDGEEPGIKKLRFTVSDNGMGMKQEFLDHIFDAFTRERDSRTDRIEGSGLGMAITKRLVDMLGGLIEVRSRQNQGTKFQVTLPMMPMQAVKLIEPAVPGAKILLVDDDPITLEYGRKVLEDLGAIAECASNDESALNMVNERGRKGQKYDLIILDLNLLGAGGLQNVQRIRDESTNGHPLLILSDYEHPDIMNGSILACVDGFVEKPFFHSTLRDCLLEHLAGRVRQEQETENYDFSKKTFLLVEDNALNREIALELLGSLGANLDTAVNGEEAVRRFQESAPGHYALILMDIQMPLMNGYDATRAIRALPRRDAKTVPVVAMTADAFLEDIQNSEAAGMNGHLAKPFDFDTLARDISRYLVDN